ncbi:MAG: serine/threonine protein kinase, partial [Prevotella sp.]|nr:serine/threonine protein kinase [Prevotella sp.]
MSIIKLQGEREKRLGIYYQLDSSQEPIGVGGMGQVYEGICVNVNTKSTRPVAIKFMYDDLPPQTIERARREASIQLRNDNLIEMLGFIETEDAGSLGEIKRHYHVVSELLNGISLADIFEGKTTDRNGEEIPFAVKMLQDYKNDSEHFARTIVINILSGLMALHDAGYIHRDIDPSNIMLTSDGHIKLIDFGIAKQMNTLTTSDKALTVAGKFMGKPEYAAPELALGDIQHQNQTTDIYAMGILLYQCIVGHTPFEGARFEILEKQLKEKLPLEQIKNKALKRIISIACEKKQEMRYQSSAQMRVALETMDGSGVRTAMSKKQKMLIAAAAAAAIVILGGGAAILGIQHNKAEEQALVALHEIEVAEKTAQVNEKIAEAEQFAKVGLNTEEDNYEQSLIKAFNAYENIEKIIAKDKTFAKTLSEISTQKTKLLSALDSTYTRLKEQAESL